MWFAGGVRIGAVSGRPGGSAAAEGRRARRRARNGHWTRPIVYLGALGACAQGLGTARWWLAAIGVALAALARWWRPSRDPDRWQRGADGEVATAQLLARLPRRFAILHDRQPLRGRGNIDHLVIGPSGVWVVDSKCRRAHLVVRRGQVWAGSHPLDVGPVAAQAAQVEKALGVQVTPLVVVHGVGLRRRGKDVGGVRVVPATRLIRRLRRGRHLHRSEVVTLAAAADQMFPPC